MVVAIRSSWKPPSQRYAPEEKNRQHVERFAPDVLKPTWLAAQAAHPRPDPYLLDPKIDSTQSAELLASGFKRMCFSLRRAKMYEDKMETLVKKIDDDGVKAKLVAAIGKIDARKQEATDVSAPI